MPLPIPDLTRTVALPVDKKLQEQRKGFCTFFMVSELKWTLGIVFTSRNILYRRPLRFRSGRVRFGLHPERKSSARLVKKIKRELPLFFEWVDPLCGPDSTEHQVQLLRAIFPSISHLFSPTVSIM